MHPVMLAALVAVAPRGRVVADSQWVLEQSTVVYHISHPLHHVDGVTHAARGKGLCQAGRCEFLIGVPVKSFDSGDSNRDLHMLQVTRGAEFPMVTVRTELPETAETADTIRADLEIQFAGQTAVYKQVPLARAVHGSDIEITGTIPATLSAFKIERPSLLSIPVKDDVPIEVDLTWHLAS